MKKFLLATACLTLAAANANAGGFQLSEYSTTQMGRAFAGYGIVGDDYSAIAFNPAGMSLKNSGMQAGVNIVALTSTAKGTTTKFTGQEISGKKGKIKDHPLVPHFYAQYKLNEKTRLGAGVYTPYGFSTNYSKHWYGRSHAIKSEITAIDFNLSASYDLTDNFTVGASIIGEYLDAELTNMADAYQLLNIDAKSKVEGDSFTPVWALGVMYKLDEDTRFGLAYHSKAKHDIRGSHHLTAPGAEYYGDAGTKLVLPEYVTFSAYHKEGQFGLSGSVKWTKWRRFKTLDIYSKAKLPTNPTGQKQSVGAVDENWKDTWMISAGVDYFYNDKLTLRTGLSYDQAGVRDMSHRTARVPDSNRWIVGVGASYKFSEKTQVDFGYAHVFMKTAKSTNRSPKGQYPGSALNTKYSSQINMFGISFQYNF